MMLVSLIDPGFQKLIWAVLIDTHKFRNSRLSIIFEYILELASVSYDDYYAAKCSIIYCLIILIVFVSLEFAP
jgi:hypothetical protein